MPLEEWDVVVVGAGPAGCAAAAAARQQLPDGRVLLLDAQTFPRDKACGDGIAAEALDILARLGFDLATILDGYPPIERLRLQAPGGAVADRTMRRPVRVVPRRVFDHRLVLDLAGRGIDVRRHSVRQIEVTGNGVVLDDTLRAGVLIGADGAESRVRRSISPDGPPLGTVALAIRGYAPELPDQRGRQQITMSGRNWPAYAWSFPLGDGTSNVGYGELVRGRPLSRVAMLDRLHELLPGLDAAPTNLRAHRLPLTPGRPVAADGRVLLVGDACSLINPLSGEGIFYALRSGAIAGGCSDLGADAGRAYRKALAVALGTHLRSTDLVARLTRRPRLIDAGVRAAAGRQRVFDDLVELALADGRLTGRLLGGLVTRSAG